jgi:hypothetical protein
LLVHPEKISTESAIAMAINACPDPEYFFTLKLYICANSYNILACASCTIAPLVRGAGLVLG